MTRIMCGVLLGCAQAVTVFANIDTAGPARETSVTVQMALSVESDLSPKAVELMRAEIERIWQPYGVALRWETPGPDGPDPQLRLTIADSDLDRP